MKKIIQKIQKPIKNSLAWAIICLLFGLILGASIMWLVQTQKFTLDTTMPSLSEKYSCNTDNDCVLAFTGDSPCAPCDFTHKDYKCVSLEKADILQQKRKTKEVLCDMCPPHSAPKPNCVCEQNICTKKTNLADKSDLIQVDIQDNALIYSPLTITGKARGVWYFEGDFAIRLLDAGDRELAVGIAFAQGEWMTTDFVPFKAQIEFTTPSTEKGVLVFEKDNASGRPEFNDELRIPVRFAKKQTDDIKPEKPACKPSGCSGVICSDKKDLVSTCEWAEEYACYKNAICERQNNVECGWRQTD